MGISVSVQLTMIPGYMLSGQPPVSIPSPLAATPTTDQQNDLSNLTAAEQQAILSAVTPSLQQLAQNYQSQQASGGAFRSWQDIIGGNGATGQQTQVQFTDDSGALQSAAAAIRQYYPSSSTSQGQGGQPQYVAPWPHPQAPADQDGDGLGDNPGPYCADCDFEGYLAKEFMPNYFISTGEQQQFAIFNDGVPWTVVQTVGTNPPNSYYHVAPLGIATDNNGNQLSAVRVDYLSLWNADGGLVGGGGACFYSWFGLDQLVNQLSSHDLDAERSVMLLAAPAVNGGFNSDPSAYRLYTIYTAAHEGTFFDQSEYADFQTPVLPGNHVNLSQSLSKHSTYGFDPDFWPITPQWFIDSTVSGITAAWALGEIDDITYGALIGAADDTFYGCLVERFGNQGGQAPNPTTNVGEVSHPLNHSGFIQDDSSRALNLADKLNNPVF